METTATLAGLKPGSRAVILGLTASGEMRRRLEDIGFVPSTSVVCIRYSPLGDPLAYRIRGSIIALRRKDAETILIREEGSYE